MAMDMSVVALVLAVMTVRVLIPRRFIVLKFRIVFWDVLPYKIIAERTSQKTILNFILAALRT
jgi:hypothetical protein